MEAWNYANLGIFNTDIGGGEILCHALSVNGFYFP